MMRFSSLLMFICLYVGLCHAGRYGKWRSPVRYHGYGKQSVIAGNYGMGYTPSYYGYNQGGISFGYPAGFSQGTSSFGYSTTGYMPSTGSSWSSMGYTPSVGSGLSGAISSIGYQSGSSMGYAPSVGSGLGRAISNINYPSGASGYYSQGMYDPYGQGYASGIY
ncbi:shematrin-like protein 1 [Ostrea edulis]|uniref:shematrin-like protein 1 n=1 Tax=Ostrea edulis TaxID=37623 RepID=UPI0024AE89B1|nr:shematrin-like protein 1 [Ostrea edulis]